MKIKIRLYLLLMPGLAILLASLLTGCQSAPATAAAITLTLASPDSGNCNQQVAVAISGTSLAQVTKVSFGNGITVNSFTVDDDKHITANITVNNDAELGTRDVSVVTTKEGASLYGAFTVKDALPVLELSSKAIELTMKQEDTSLPVGKLTIRNSGGGTLNWSAESERTWLELSPAKGSIGRQSLEITLSLKLSSGMLAYAPYSTTIRFSAPGAVNSPQEVSVNFKVITIQRNIFGEKGIITRESGQPVELIDNPKANNPAYSELMKFLGEETTDRMPFTSKQDASDKGLSPFGYTDYAEAVHNNAESAGLRAAVVTVDIETEYQPYTINAFETTDKGLVFIDCTGESGFSQLDELTPPKTGISRDKVAYVEKDKVYGTIPIDEAASPSYSFYETHAKKWQEYKNSLSIYTSELEQFNKDTLRFPLMTPAESAIYDAQYNNLREMEVSLANLRDEFGEFEFKPLGITRNFVIYWSGGKK